MSSLWLDNASVDAAAVDALSRVTPAAPYPPVPAIRPAGETAETAAAAPVALPADSARVSDRARGLVRGYVREVLSRRVRDADNVAERIYRYFQYSASSPALRELMAGFSQYDNTRAVQHYLTYVRTTAAYGNPSGLIRFAGVGMLPQDVFLYRQDGFRSLTNADARAYYDARVREVDRWLRGQTVFRPELLDYPSSEGFRFIPGDDQAALVANARAVAADGDNARIANYLSILATLTPLAFLFYDPTGLGALPFVERQDFLAQVDEAVVPATPRIPAIELEYAFNPERELELAMVWQEVDDLDKEVQDRINGRLDHRQPGRLHTLREYAGRLLLASQPTERQEVQDNGNSSR